MKTTRFRLLFVEDQLIEEPYLALPFRNRGFAVDCATTGLEAYEKIKSVRYDAIVLDNMLPGGGENGSEWSFEKTGSCLRTGLILLRKLAELGSPPLVWVLTGLPDTNMEREEKSFEFVVEHIKKDYSLFRLANQIYEVLEAREVTSQ